MRMPGRKNLFIIAILLIIICPALFIGSAISYVPLIFVLLLLFLSYLYAFIALRCFQIAVESKYIKRHERLSSTDYGINIENKGFLVLPRVSFSVNLESEDGYLVSNYKYDFMLNPKGKKELKLTMPFPHIGRFRVIISKIRFYGFIDGLFLYKNTKWKEELLVTPKIYEINNYEIDTLNPFFLVNYHVPRKIRGGEFNDVREYIPGDPIKNIHWKLSAHLNTNTLITRIINADAVSGITVYLDLASEGDFDYNKAADMYDCMVESAYAAALYALSKDYGISFVFSANNYPTYYFTKTYEELDKLIYSLPKVSAEEKYPIELLVAEYACTVMSFDNIIVLSDKISFELINALSDCKERGRFPLLCLIRQESSRGAVDEEIKDRLIKSGIRYCVINTAKDFSSALGGLK